MTKGSLLTLCTFFVAVLSCSKKDKQDDQPPVNEKVKAVQETLATNTDLKTFSDAFAKVTISNADAAQGLTVFAPVNSAVTAYDPNARVTANALTEAEVKDHIVKGIIKLADITNGKKLTSLSGKELVFAVENDNIWVNGALIGDVEEDSTGVVFTIDQVLSAKPGKAEITVYDGTQWSVSNADGKVVAGADVALYYTRTDFTNDQPAFTGQTDAAGKITFNNLPVGTYYLVAKKGDKLNYFDPVNNGGSIVAYKAVGIYQTQEEINSGVLFPGAVPGDFKYQDTNGDGKIDGNDKVAVPFEVTITSNKTATVKSLIGYTFNHVVANFQNKAEAQTLLDNVYTGVGSWQIQQTVIDGIMSDDADCAGFQNYCAFENFTVVSTNSIVNSFWQTAYNNVSSLNRIINNLPALNLPAQEADPLVAQARALRGYIYLQLATYFGELPLQESILTPVNIQRSMLTETYDFIKNDLTSAMGKLPNKWTGADAKRVSAHACKLLLARVAVAQNDFLKVKQYSGELMESAEYQLVNTNLIFVSATNAELLWNIGPIPQQFLSFFTGKEFSPAIRYAEVLLLNTEARILLGESDMTGLNMVLARRGQSPVTFVSQQQATQAVREAWQSEFSREGQRFAKLVKWNIALAVLNAQGFREWYGILPIPQAYQNIHPNIQQNPGY